MHLSSSLSSFIASSFITSGTVDFCRNTIVSKLWFSTLLVLLSSTGSLSSTAQGGCKYVPLVKCLINVLDDWAWALYESRDNPITISDEGCGHFRALGTCITEGTAMHGCNKQEIVDASRTVSDLLTHRKNSGTFLKAYYMVQYSCSEEGRKEIATHRECLAKEEIGKQTLAAASYLEDKLRHEGITDPTAGCNLVKTKLNEFRLIVGPDLCGGESEKLMCESLSRMFTSVESDVLGDCSYDCSTPDGEPPSPPEATPPAVGGEETVGQETAGNTGAGAGAANGAGQAAANVDTNGAAKVGDANEAASTVLVKSSQTAITVLRLVITSLFTIVFVGLLR